MGDRRPSAGIWSDTTRRMFGLPSGTRSLTLRRLLSLVVPQDRPASRQGDASHVATRTASTRTEFRITRPDRCIRWVRASAIALANGDGSSKRLLGVTADITEEKEVLDAVQESETRFRSVFEMGILPMAFWHADGRITDANDAYLRLTGFSRSEVESGELRWERLTAPEFRHLDEKALRDLKLDRPVCALREGVPAAGRSPRADSDRRRSSSERTTASASRWISPRGSASSGSSSPGFGSSGWSRTCRRRSQPSATPGRRSDSALARQVGRIPRRAVGQRIPARPEPEELAARLHVDRPGVRPAAGGGLGPGVRGYCLVTRRRSRGHDRGLRASSQGSRARSRQCRPTRHRRAARHSAGREREGVRRADVRGGRRPSLAAGAGAATPVDRRDLQQRARAKGAGGRPPPGGGGECRDPGLPAGHDGDSGSSRPDRAGERGVEPIRAGTSRRSSTSMVARKIWSRPAVVPRRPATRLPRRSAPALKRS